MEERTRQEELHGKGLRDILQYSKGGEQERDHVRLSQSG